jgi:hypothetical protein
MRAVHFYHKDTGLLGNVFFTSDDSLVAKNTPPDHLYVEGRFDALSQRVDVTTGKVVDYQPPSPSPDHAWDASAKRWALSQAAQARLDADSAARARLRYLEHHVQPRALRDHVLRGDTSRLKQIDDEITELRKQLYKDPA